MRLRLSYLSHAFFLALAVCLSLPRAALAEVLPVEVRPNDTVVFYGQTGVFAEMAGACLVSCGPSANVRVQILGERSRKIGELADPASEVITAAKPDIAVLCYGTAEALEAKSAGAAFLERYRRQLTEAVRNIRNAGARSILLASPTAPDFEIIRRTTKMDAEAFRNMLMQLRQFTAEVARDERVTFVDLYTPMDEVITKARTAQGYAMSGPDTIFPSDSAAIIPAFSLLKALGCDGNIATIAFDIAAPGNALKKRSGNGWDAEIESSRYAFSFGTKAPVQNSPADPRTLLPFVPFNNELNRYILIVKNLPEGKWNVKWNGEDKAFTSGELGRGVNLADAFVITPFSAPIREAMDEIKDKKQYYLYKRSIMDLTRDVEAKLPDTREAAARLREAANVQLGLTLLPGKDQRPVIRHTISITPLAAP